MRRSARALLALAAGIAAALAAAVPAHADVQDFSYDSWHVEYDIGVQADGRAIAHVTETIVARFPDFPQNKGLVRGMPIDYQGASTDPRDFTVTDEHGNDVPFWTEKEDGFIAVLTGTNDYVLGVQTYVIGYTLSDVVLARDDESADEFYWQLVDVEHLQPIARFSAEIRLDETLAGQLNGDAACYIGRADSGAHCEMQRSGGSFSVAPVPLGPYEAVTVAIGLQPGSIVQPSVRLPDFALDGLPLYLGGAALAMGIASSTAAARMVRKRRSYRGVVIVQYDVPAELPPLIAAPIVASRANPIPAQFVHLSVNGATRLEEGSVESGIFKLSRAQPAIRLLDPARAVDPLDTGTLEVLFPARTPGEVFTVPKNDEDFARKMLGLTSEGRVGAVQRGYFERVRSPLARKLGAAALILAAVLAALAVLGFATRNSATPVFAVIGALATLMLALGAMSKHTVHTPLGAETREYLLGVREFIEVAEADRIKMLQSYEGAERAADGTVNVIRLYEKLLPYAMIFGLEKQWGKVLETAYEQQSAGMAPAWYPAVAAHGFAQMQGTLSQFTSSLTSSASYSSSSSGGSSGGGSVGGGGGGGFSGGR